MSARVFNGNRYAKILEAKLKARLDKLKISPRLASIIFYEDKSSQTYTRLKMEVASRVGIEFDRVDVSFLDFIDQVTSKTKILSNRPDIHGVMVQKPSKTTWRKYQDPTTHSHTSYHDWWSSLTLAIDPQKDVDCLTRANLDKVYRGESDFIPATARAVIHILDQAFRGEFKTQIKGKSIAMVGRSELVGKPLHHVFKQMGASSKLLGSKDDISAATISSDIIISATGATNLITADMIKEGSIVIDVGDPKGDVEFSSVSKKASFITPVPDGVGPVTVVSLLENLLSLLEIAKK